jgi:sugar/nucleoside kinase (ribokinase family)
MLSQRVAFVDRVADAAPTSAAWLVVSGYLLLEPGAGDAVAGMRERAPRRMLLGCAVPDASLEAWQAAADALEPDIVVLNRDEAARLPALAPDRRVVTGSDGATGVVGGVRTSVRTPSGGRAIDATGAGDAFAAAFLAALLDAWPPDDGALRGALEAGASAGAAATRASGAQGYIPGEGSAMVDR